MASADVVVAAHDPRRRVDRAVASILDGPGDVEARAIVVAHEIPLAELLPQLAPHADDERLVLVEHADGVRSPAGPFNRGLEVATATYVAVLGSDDFLEPGALRSWVGHAERHATDYLIAPLRNQDGGQWRDPLTRPGRSRRLDPVRDRLDYRTAPLGLVRRSYLEHIGVRLTPGMATGEDIELGLALIHGGGRIDADRSLPAYVVGGDAPQRVTLAPRSMADELEALTALLGRPWLGALDRNQREAIGVKFWRMHVVPAVIARSGERMAVEDMLALRTVAAAIARLAPGAARTLSRTEAAVVSAATDGDAAAMERAVASARSARPQDRLLTSRPRDTLRRDTMLRRALRMRVGR